MIVLLLGTYNFFFLFENTEVTKLGFGLLDG